MPEKAKHYGISTALPAPVDPSTEPLVLQFDLKLSDGLSCGGAYLKFLTHEASFQPADLKDNSPYTVMFGPDKCGATNKVHLILRHTNQKTKAIEEKHLVSPPSVLTDDNTHVYTAILYPGNNSYAVLIDGEERKAGSLFNDFDPAIVPPQEIDDPEDSKPKDWVDEPKIADPDAKKPDDWDEDAPEFIPDEEAEKPEGWLDDEPTEIDDPEAEKPEDWDDEEDGDWEAPQVPNPKCKDAPGCGEWVRPTKANPAYKGKWTAPLIDNPKYKGPWAPRKIANPSFHNDTAPLSHIGQVGAVAVEIWTMDNNYYFDNVVVGNSPAEAAAIRESTMASKKAIEKEIADRKEAEAKAKADKEAAAAAATGAGVLSKIQKPISDALSAALESPILAPVVPEGIRELIVSNSLVVVAAIVAALAAVLGGPLLASAGKAQAEAVAVGKSKKTDGDAVAKPAASAASPAKKGAAGKKEEIQEEEEDEDEDASNAQAGGVRRRVRRD